MHMADALLSPAVGGAFWVAGAGAVAWASRRARREDPEGSRVPLMGVLGAFVFTAQMINFTIPATGSSGHIGGGLLLAILLGPHAALLVIASVLTVQSLFFADGGLLALGANLFNLGVFPCFVGLPLYRRIAGPDPSPARAAAGTLFGAVAALQLGALAVVLQTVLSGISALPFAGFLALMLPIHLGIGIVEGLVTAAVVSFLLRARPELRETVHGSGTVVSGTVMAGVAVAAVLLGGIVSWFASSHPDGLEWSILRITGSAEMAETGGGVHHVLAGLQRETAFLPGYAVAGAEEVERPAAWPVVDPATSLAGLLGGTLTLLMAFAAGWLLRRRGQRRQS